MFRANVTIKLQTAAGIDTLRPGEVFKSKDPQLQTLVDQGIISYWCYWLEQAVDECPTVCINQVDECPYYAEWLEIKFAGQEDREAKGGQG